MLFYTFSVNKMTVAETSDSVIFILPSYIYIYGYSFLNRSVKILAKLGPQSWLSLMSTIKKNPWE